MSFPLGLQHLRRETPAVSMSESWDSDARRGYDPYARDEELEKQQKTNEFKMNVGNAIDSLNEDIPNILRKQPNWAVFTADIELDLMQLDQVSLQLFKTAAPGFITDQLKIRGLIANIGVAQQLQQFRASLVSWDEVKVRTSLSVDRFGDQVIECRWNARLGIKAIQMPSWASPLSDMMQQNFGASFSQPFGSSNTKEPVLELDAVSRFHLNPQGRIYRHVIDNQQLLLDGQTMSLDLEMMLQKMTQPGWGSAIA